MLRPHCNPECIEAGTPFHSVFTVVHIATRIDGQTQLRENKKSVRIFYFKGDRPGKCPHATSDCGVEQIHTVNINHADSSYNHNLFLKLERPGFFLVPPPAALSNVDPRRIRDIVTLSWLCDCTDLCTGLHYDGMELGMKSQCLLLSDLL